jgi:hypothetical protein
MTLAIANAYAASLASTLMVTVVVFRAGDGSLSVLPSDEIDDGDDLDIINEHNPYDRRPAH